MQNNFCQNYEKILLVFNLTVLIETFSFRLYTRGHAGGHGGGYAGGHACGHAVRHSGGHAGGLMRELSGGWKPKRDTRHIYKNANIRF